MLTPTPPSSSATAHAETTHTTHHLSAKKFTLHFLEMVVAMAVGMVALHPVWTFALVAAGWSAILDAPEAMAMIMATDMTIAMTAWMKYRGHS